MTGDIKQIMLQDQAQINQALESARQFIERDYMNVLSSDRCSLQPVYASDPAAVRICRMDKIILGEEDMHARLVSVFHTVHSVADACFVLIIGKPEGAGFYLGIRSEKVAPMAAASLKTSMNGNFPGTLFHMLSTEESSRLLADELGEKPGERRSVAAVSRIPSRRKVKDPSYDTARIQGLERFIDAMKGQTYTALILAVPLKEDEVAQRRNALENISSSLSSFEKISYQYSDNMTLSEQHSLNMSLSESVTRSVMNGYNTSYMDSSGTTRGNGRNLNMHFNGLGIGFGSQDGSFTSQGVQVGDSVQWQHGRTTAGTRGASVMKGVSLGISEGWTLTYTNKSIGNMCRTIDQEIERIDNCQTYGCWETCAFFAAPGAETARVAAGNYHALVCGENSGRSNASVNVWSGIGSRSEEQNRIQLLDSLKALRMPGFMLDNRFPCSIGTMVSSEELPLLMNFPRYSVSGLPVVKMAGFGREVTCISPRTVKINMKIGHTFHMGQVEENSPVSAAAEDFTSHVLFCGSTGVGKSTLTAMILKGLSGVNVNFMLIEPVKGEYKYLLGNIPGLNVFTTDPRVCRMLRINPFEFPEGIHVLSHIDRLLEVFNVCWPLYAAQPALLRECIEEAYIQAGWDLGNSVYIRSGAVRYPDFRLLLSVVPGIIEASRFVGESKGTYEGALLTRIGMLTRGIYGQVFNGCASIPDGELFDGRVIVDLSGGGSRETNALIMGILTIRLREYRSVTGRADNSPLKHILVLEEAHNLLRREEAGNVEGGENASGKSVEMLSSCIAEMRSYGQGVFIVDQSPSKLDDSAIRNTATKVVMQLPEAEDQKVIAHSLSLTKEQTEYLAHFPCQTALIYQAGWTEPVLVRIAESRLQPAASVSGTSYSALKSLRGACIRRILPMWRDTYRPAEIDKAIQTAAGIPEDKKKDFLLLTDSYKKIYDADRTAGDIKKETAFYSRLCRELLCADDLLKLVSLPKPAAGLNDAQNDPSFRMECGIWKKNMNTALEQYVEGLTETEKSQLIRLLLLCDLENGRAIAVHNVLFGMI